MVAEVKLFGKKVGAVAWNSRRGFATFEFERSFPRAGLDLAPLTMPLTEVRRGKTLFSFPYLPKATFHGLPGLLADHLPDDFGNQVINSWLASQGRNPASFNPVERLCYIGTRAMGALEFQPVIDRSFSGSNRVNLNELVSLAREVIQSRKDFVTNLKASESEAFQDIIKVGTSAGGAQAKAILAIHPETGEVRSGQIDAPEGFEHWLLKFDGVEERPEPRGRLEFAYFLLAKDCGIEIMPCKLMEENGRAHFMTRRFDRPGEGRKLHLQTLSAMNHLDFYSPSSYEQAFLTLFQLKLPAKQIDAFYRRMVFNIMARNLDDHTKNFSFIMDEEGAWRLAPAYDLTYNYGEYFRRHRLSVNGKYDGIEESDLLAVGTEMNVKSRQDIIDAVRAGMQNWSLHADHAGLTKALTDRIGNTFLT